MDAAGPSGTTGTTQGIHFGKNQTYANRSYVRWGDEKKKGVESSWITVSHAEFPDPAGVAPPAPPPGRIRTTSAGVVVGPDQEDVLELLSRKIHAARNGTHRLLSWLRGRADRETDIVGRDVVAALLPRFTVHLPNEEDVEKFVDLFDPDHTGGCNYRDVLTTVAGDLFDFKKPDPWVSSADWIEWLARRRQAGRSC